MPPFEHITHAPPAVRTAGDFTRGRNRFGCYLDGSRPTYPQPDENALRRAHILRVLRELGPSTISQIRRKLEGFGTSNTQVAIDSLIRRGEVCVIGKRGRGGANIYALTEDLP